MQTVKRKDCVEAATPSIVSHQEVDSEGIGSRGMVSVGSGVPEVRAAFVTK
jgi:hypothetical protein